MTFPDSYKILSKNIFQKGDFKLVPIRFEDRYDIMKWRNEQIYHLRQTSPLTIENQDDYFKSIVYDLFFQEQPNQLLFSLLKHDKLIGYGGLVHINRVDNHAEISFIMDTELEKENFEELWLNYLNLIEKVAFNEMNFHKIFTYAFDLRPKLFNTLEKANFYHEATLKEHCYFDNTYIDVLIHTKINTVLNINYRRADKKDIDIIFNLANDEKARANSFHSGKIKYEEHQKWFLNKITDKNSLLIIAELDNSVVGLIRYDNEINHSIVGLNISPIFRGKKLSARLLKESASKFSSKINFPIHALIKETNIPSIKAFEKAGYSFLKNEIINNHKSLLYLLNHVK